MAGNPHTSAAERPVDNLVRFLLTRSHAVSRSRFGREGVERESSPALCERAWSRVETARAREGTLRATANSRACRSTQHPLSCAREIRARDFRQASQLFAVCVTRIRARKERNQRIAQALF